MSRPLKAESLSYLGRVVADGCMTDPSASSPHLFVLQDLFGPEWRGHTLLAFSHGDRVDQARLGSTEYLMQASDAFRALLETVEHRHHFVDNSAAWLRTEGRPLLDKLLLLTRKNKYRGLQLKSV